MADIGNKISNISKNVQSNNNNKGVPNKRTPTPNND